MSVEDTLNVIQQQFILAVRKNLFTHPASGAIDIGSKRQKLLAAYAEELSRTRLKWQHLQDFLVAGA